MVELELQLFLHRHGYPVHLAHGRLGSPEGDDIVKLSSHRRDETLVVVTRRQQGVGETFFGDLVLHDISRLQAAHFQHDLPGAPVDGTCGGGVVASLGYVEIDHVAVRTVDRGVTKLGVRRQRVVIVFDDTVGDGSFGSLYLKSLAYGESPRAGRLYRYGGAIQQGDAVVSCIGLRFLQGRILRVSARILPVHRR